MLKCKVYYSLLALSYLEVIAMLDYPGDSSDCARCFQGRSLELLPYCELAIFDERRVH